MGRPAPGAEADDVAQGLVQGPHDARAVPQERGQALIGTTGLRRQPVHEERVGLWPFNRAGRKRPSLTGSPPLLHLPSSRYAAYVSGPARLTSGLPSAQAADGLEQDNRHAAGTA
jgi:hypothetical protein